MGGTAPEGTTEGTSEGSATRHKLASLAGLLTSYVLA